MTSDEIGRGYMVGRRIASGARPRHQFLTEGGGWTSRPEDAWRAPTERLARDEAAVRVRDSDRTYLHVVLCDEADPMHGFEIGPPVIRGHGTPDPHARALRNALAELHARGRLQVFMQELRTSDPALYDGVQEALDDRR